MACLHFRSVCTVCSPALFVHLHFLLLGVSTSLYNLAGRPAHSFVGGVAEKYSVPARQPTLHNRWLTHDYSQMQTIWKEYVAMVRELCVDTFWKVLSVVQEQSHECQDNMLKEFRKILIDHQVGLSLGHKWPTTTRSLRERVSTQAGDFWTNVKHTITVRLGPAYKDVSFTFIDPCFVWVRQVEELRARGINCFYNPLILRKPGTGEEMYGGGVEFGLMMRAAKDSIPDVGDPALMDLSWDGGETGIGELSVTPILIQVMNSNRAVPETTGLVGYMPVVETSDACRQLSSYKDAQHKVLQVIWILKREFGFQNPNLGFETRIWVLLHNIRVLLNNYYLGFETQIRVMKPKFGI